MKPPPDPHYRHRFPAEIISQAVWLYHVFSLSLRDVELLLAERMFETKRAVRHGGCSVALQAPECRGAIRDDSPTHITHRACRRAAGQHSLSFQTAPSAGD